MSYKRYAEGLEGSTEDGIKIDVRDKATIKQPIKHFYDSPEEAEVDSTTVRLLSDDTEHTPLVPGPNPMTWR